MLFALLITILIATNISLFHFLKENESAIISRVIDGDTLELADGRIIRLLNINTPEKNEFGSELAKSYLKTFENSSINLEVAGIDKYQRVLARIYAPDYINLQIVKLGLARKFLVDKAETRIFLEAEEGAIKGSLGIWKKSSYYGCFKAEVDAKEELVKIINNCPAISISGWIIRDESRKFYKFGNISIGKINIHSGAGKDNETSMFWNSGAGIWNNDRDTLYLFDSENKIALHHFYGY